MNKQVEVGIVYPIKYIKTTVDFTDGQAIGKVKLEGSDLIFSHGTNILGCMVIPTTQFVGINSKGADYWTELADINWSGATAYKIGAKVYSGTKYWNCLKANTNVEPTEGEDWTEVTLLSLNYSAATSYVVATTTDAASIMYFTDSKFYECKKAVKGIAPDYAEVVPTIQIQTIGSVANIFATTAISSMSTSPIVQFVPAVVGGTDEYGVELEVKLEALTAGVADIYIYFI